MALFVLLMGTGMLLPIATQAQRYQVNISLFRQELSRHGRWMMHPRFGEVWYYNEPGFRPYYTNGYWDYGPDGWEWVSDYEWGWATFHYGRWELDPYYGWLWIPGYEWAPAWVSWSEGNEYYGWAPMGFGVSVNINIGNIPGNRWVFCPRNRIYGREFRNYCAPYSYYRRILPSINFINVYGGREQRYWAGPDRREVERYTGRRVERQDYQGGYNNRNSNGNGQNRPFINRPYSNTERSNQQQPAPPTGNSQRNPFERRYDQRDVDYGQQGGQGRPEPPRVERGQATERPAERPVERSVERPAERPVQRRESVERPRRERE